jgi:outer membrane receptor protein involved in Fe transport
LPDSSKWHASIFGRYQLTERWAIGGGMVYKSAPAPAYDLPADFSWGSSIIVNLFTRYEATMFRYPFTIGLNINNLFDTTYYAGQSFGNPGIHAKLNFTWKF